jgi:hypothetical protein
MVLLAGFASAAGEVMFVYKLEAGSSQRYRLKLNTEMEMMAMEMSQMADLSVTVACVAVDKDMHTMNMVFDKVEASNMIAGNMQPDASAAKMAGKTVTFMVDSHGTVSNIAPGPGFDAWPEVQQVVEPTLKNWYVYLPAKAVPVGGEWKRENHRDKSSSGSEYVSNEKFKFREMKKGKGGDVAVVDEDVTTEVGGSTETPMGVFNLAGAGKGKFEFSFNPATGAITRLKGTMETNIDMTPQSGGEPMKTSVANHIERELLE